MTTTVSAETTPAPADEPRSRSWGDVAFHFAGEVAALPNYDRGGFAGLRRMDPDEPDTAAFWRLMAGEELLGNPDTERKWGLILHGMALMTRTAGGDDIASRSAHNGRMPVGRALYENGYSETRFNRLLTARDDMLRVLLARMFRMMAAKDASFDWREMAAFILGQGYDDDRDETRRRRLARDYYRAERRSTQQAAESQGD